MQNGIPLLEISKNQRTRKNNFVFPNTNQLHDLIDRWQIENHKSRKKQ